MILGDLQKAWDVAKEFQLEDAEFMARNNGGVAGHKTGLGKTFISQLAWSRWPDANKVLILGTLGSCATWDRLLMHWAGIKPVFMQGMSDPNWNAALSAKEGIFMCTYATFIWLMKSVLRGKPRFDLVVCDELHKNLRTRNQTWKAIKRLDFDRFIGCSATWLSRGPQELFPVLSLINHLTFSSYWRFVNTWCYVEKSDWGNQVFGVKNKENLRAMLWDRYYRARTWPEVGSQFGATTANPVIKRPERIVMGAQQRQLIEDLERDMVACLDQEMVITPNSLALLTRKLQMAVTPKLLLPSAEYGGPIEWLQSKVSEDRHTVIFCPFRDALDIIKQALVEDGYEEKDIFILKGGTKPDDITKMITIWKAVKGVMLCTTAFAQSFPLDTTDTAYSLGFSWDPNENEQAEGRLRRLDSLLKTPCLMTYIVPEHSDYENVVAVLDGKVIDTRDYLFGYKKNYWDRRHVNVDIDSIPYAPGEEPSVG